MGVLSQGCSKHMLQYYNISRSLIGFKTSCIVLQLHRRIYQMKDACLFLLLSSENYVYWFQLITLFIFPREKSCSINTREKGCSY